MWGRQRGPDYFLLNAEAELRQLGEFSSGLREDRDVGVGVLPQCEEVLEGSPGVCRVARERGATRQTQVRNRIVQSPIRIEPGTTPTGAFVIQDLPELGRGLSASWGSTWFYPNW